MVQHRPDGGVYLGQAGKSHVILSAAEQARLHDFAQRPPATTPAKARLGTALSAR